MLQDLFNALGYGLCHQLPERSFFAGGFQLPVCARDTGIYFGFTLALIALYLIAGGRKTVDLPRWPVLVLVGLFITAMGIDGVTSYAGLRQTTNDIRLITGLMTGWGLATLTFPMLNSQLWADCRAGRSPDGAAQTGLWLGSLALAFAVLRWLAPLLGVVYPLLLAVAIVATFTAVNLVFVGLVPSFERRARRLRDLAPAMGIAVVLTVLELAATAWLRTAAEGLIG